MKCPICKGEGGYKEVILDDGTGPYYPCDYCGDKGTVRFKKWIKWFWYNTIWTVSDLIEKKKETTK